MLAQPFSSRQRFHFLSFRQLGGCGGLQFSTPVHKRHTGFRPPSSSPSGLTGGPITSEPQHKPLQMNAPVKPEHDEGRVTNMKFLMQRRASDCGSDVHAITAILFRAVSASAALFAQTTPCRCARGWRQRRWRFQNHGSCPWRAPPGHCAGRSCATAQNAWPVPHSPAEYTSAP